MNRRDKETLMSATETYELRIEVHFFWVTKIALTWAKNTSWTDIWTKHIDMNCKRE